MKPKIRLNGFDKEWDTCTLGDVAKIIGGGTPSTFTPSYWNGNIPWFTPSEIGKNKYVYNSERSITKEGLDNSSAKLLPSYSILLSSRATIGEASINIKECCTNQGFQSLLPTNTDLDFLYYLINTKKKVLIRESSGSTFLEISANKVRSIEIDVPCFGEQQKIGEWLSNLDSLIQSTIKKVESLKQVKAASLQVMFPQEGETTPRLRFKGFEGEWKEAIIGDLGKTYSGLFGKSKEDFGHGRAKYITFLNVLNNAHIDIEALELVDVQDCECQNAVKKGDLFFNTSSETPEEVGMCSVLDIDIPKVYLNSFCFGFRITNNSVCSAFIAYLMRSPIGRKIMTILAQGATRYNLSKNNLCNTKILIPCSSKEQEMIASYFTNLDHQITLHSLRLEKLKQIKSACLDNMFV